jgi:hypothetical protein
MAEFAGSTQNVKKNCQNIKSTNQNENVPKKNLFSTLKVKRSQKFTWRFSTNSPQEPKKQYTLNYFTTLNVGYR